MWGKGSTSIIQENLVFECLEMEWEELPPPPPSLSLKDKDASLPVNPTERISSIIHLELLFSLSLSIDVEQIHFSTGRCRWKRRRNRLVNMLALLLFLSLLSLSLSSDRRQCQCQCCRYMGPTSSNQNNLCPCQLKDQAEAFPCSTIPSGKIPASVCPKKIRHFYDPHRPNICCHVKFL